MVPFNITVICGLQTFLSYLCKKKVKAPGLFARGRKCDVSRFYDYFMCEFEFDMAFSVHEIVFKTNLGF